MCWGREYDVIGSGGETQPNWTKQMYQSFVSGGHEVGNHTIDHMESNSGLPIQEWPNSGEGFDNVDEDEQYPIWEYQGWLVDAGKKISTAAWKDAVQLAEAELSEKINVSVANGNLYGFRAPRLELNSNLFFALSELGYTYDCGLEEGWENNIDGKNLYWPYTTDNGSPNSWTQTENGEDMSHLKSWPTGFWEIPCNTMIIPEGIRDAVWANGKQIFDNAPDAEDWEPLEEWKKHGRITGFDFNMFILWGMTSANWLETMKYNLDLRLESNKAPLAYGLHSDYYTPMYDYATLLNDYNKSSYGLCVSEGWNTFDTRIDVVEQFVDYALSKGCEFVNGIELINKIKDIQKDEHFGGVGTYSSAEWEFYKNPALNSSTSQDNFTGNITNATITVDKITGSEVPWCGYGAYETQGFFNKIDHIEVTYKTTAPLLLKFTVSGDKPWEVLLNNIGSDVNSGRIPISAFHYSQYDPGTQTAINTAKINGIEIQVLTVGDNVEDVTFSLKDVKLYGAAGVSIVSDYTMKAANLIAVNAITKKALKLKIGETGKYNINILSASGRTIKSFKDINLSVGNHSLKLNNLSNGIYMINVSTNKMQRTIKVIIM